LRPPGRPAGRTQTQRSYSAPTAPENTEFVRTPKHGIRGKLGSWTSTKHRAARSLTPLVELGLAGYFLVALVVALVAWDAGELCSPESIVGGLGPSEGPISERISVGGGRNVERDIESGAPLILTDQRRRQLDRSTTLSGTGTLRT
jgi:hypothetical protein